MATLTFPQETLNSGGAYLLRDGTAPLTGNLQQIVPLVALDDVPISEPVRLIKMDVELERFDATIKEEMNHPELATIGLGDIDDARMKKAIDILVDANKLPRTPTVSEIFTREFLPPKSERPIKLIDVKTN